MFNAWVLRHAMGVANGVGTNSCTPRSLRKPKMVAGGVL